MHTVSRIIQHFALREEASLLLPEEHDAKRVSISLSLSSMDAIKIRDVRVGIILISFSSLDDGVIRDG